MASTNLAVTPKSSVPDDIALDEQLVQRVYGEFLEMPGLRLTAQQAQRLWGLDGPTCQKVLRVLVDGRFLCDRGDGMYARLTDGDPFSTPPRMAKASLPRHRR
jgi:hypothetical protein